jgi:hypothetical protein
MRIAAVLLVIWLALGAVAAAQRDYFTNTDAGCAKLSSTALTIVSGPLNYIGINPKIKCKVPQPSK